MNKKIFFETFTSYHTISQGILKMVGSLMKQLVSVYRYRVFAMSCPYYVVSPLCRVFIMSRFYHVEPLTCCAIDLSDQRRQQIVRLTEDIELI